MSCRQSFIVINQILTDFKFIKVKLKKLRPLMLLAVVLLLTNCQEDMYERKSSTSIDGVQITTKHFKEFKNLPKLIDETITRERIKKSADTTDIYNFTIDSTQVMEIVNNNGKFYTMLIRRDFDYSVDMFENLVISDRQGLKEAFIISYAPDQDYYERLEMHPMAPFKGGVCATRLDYKNLQKSGDTNCFTIYTVFCTRGDFGTHIAHTNCYSQPAYLFVQSYTRCLTTIVDAPVFKPLQFASNYGNFGNGGASGDGGSNIFPLDYEPDDQINIGEGGPITGPVNFKQEAHEDNCKELKKMSLNPKIKSKIKILQGLAEENGENGFGFSDTAEPETLQQSTGPNALTQVRLNTGGTRYGGAHTHPNQNTTNAAPMFSISDIIGLAMLKARYFNPDAFLNDSKFFFTLTVQNYGSQTTSTYAIKIENGPQLRVFLDSYLAMSPTEKAEICQELADKYGLIKKEDPNASNLRVMTLLKYMEEVNLGGVSLYKATDENLSGWEKLALDPTKTFIKYIPCN